MSAAGTLIVDRDVDLGGIERGTAWFSPDRVYRYLLTRRWDVMRPVMAFVMFNPSKAGAFSPDPTVTRCCGFARREGCGGIEVGNLHALCATDPAEVSAHPDPVGPENDAVLEDLARITDGPVVAAWGALGSNGRDLAVARMFARLGVPLQCLGTTKAGAPRHPLYVRGDVPLSRWAAPGTETAA